MIGYLKGRVIEQSENQVIVGIGEDSSIGYTVTVPNHYLLSGPVELYIHSHIREDAFELFGFQSKKEKEIFNYLISVNGVGPKAAVGVLSHMDPEDLIQVILSEDRARLTKLPGIGKKTAERILLDLKEKLEKHYSAQSIPKQSEMKVGSAYASIGLYQEALQALKSLGYKEHELKGKLDQLFQSEQKPKKIEDVIRSTLQQLG